MKRTELKFRAALLSPLLVYATLVVAQAESGISVTKAGSQPSTLGSTENFTGDAWIDSRFQAAGPGRVRGASVTFEPGARTAWHKHPLGQTLIVVSGIGWVQHWDGPVHEIRAGDVVWIPPDVKHWHGATSSNGMSHIAISEALDGATVEWLEHVTQEQYRR
jgi:quercetin dioxygenase-like cupin family protein